MFEEQGIGHLIQPPIFITSRRLIDSEINLYRIMLSGIVISAENMAFPLINDNDQEIPPNATMREQYAKLLPHKLAASAYPGYHTRAVLPEESGIATRSV